VIKSRAAFRFGHNVEHPLSPLLISSYHPSQQNTSTGRLTDQMLLDVFLRARRTLGMTPPEVSVTRPETAAF
jgi:uracil-DNA glycosylase